MAKSNQEVLDIWAKDPFVCIEDVWGLTPQKILPKYEEFYDDVLERSREEGKLACEVLDEIKLSMFEPFQK
jgi:hypothetical protein